MLRNIGKRNSPVNRIDDATDATPLAVLRVTKELNEIDIPEFITYYLVNEGDVRSFVVRIEVQEGLWRGAIYRFIFDVPISYPLAPPIVKCQDKLFHPNISYDGDVCMNLLREDWQPSCDVNMVIYGLLVLFEAPNAVDPLNPYAAELLRNNATAFDTAVASSLRGEEVDGQRFPRQMIVDQKRRR